MRKQNTANVYSQLGRRKRPDVIYSRRPKNFLNKDNATMHKYILRPIYTEELPGAAAHDSLFVSLRPGVARRAVHERRISRRNKTNKESCAVTPGNSSV